MKKVGFIGTGGMIVSNDISSPDHGARETRHRLADITDPADTNRLFAIQ